MQTVHAARAHLWMRTVRAQNDLADWVEYPDHPSDETPDVLAARHELMRERYCARVKLTRFILARAGLLPDVNDCVPCNESSKS